MLEIISVLILFGVVALIVVELRQNTGKILEKRLDKAREDNERHARALREEVSQNIGSSVKIL